MTDDLLDAERAVLGGMMLSAAIIDEVALTPAEHYQPRHELIHAAILTLHAAGKPTDSVAVAGELSRGGDLGRAGGPAYLAECMTACPAAASAPYYAEKVREAAALRAVATTGARMQQMATSPGTSAAEILERARGELDHAAERIAAPAAADLHATLEDAIQALDDGPVTGVPSPWVDVDRITGGWRPGTVNVVAGRPGTGKSVLGAQSALHAALHGAVPLVVSCEMTRVEVTNRWLASLAAVDLSPARLKDRKLTEPEWQRIAQAQGRLADIRATIDDRSTVTVADIRARARETRRRHGSLGLVVVDYLQLLTANRRKDGNREQEVAEMSRSMKIMAGDLAVPVILLAQLNRGPEHRNDRRPRISDLRESGAVEQDADVILLLHRDEEKSPDVLDVGVGKNRGGPTGSASLAWQGAYSRVVARAWTPHDVAGVA